VLCCDIDVCVLLLCAEADMLLEGSYKQDVEKIFDVFKVLRRRTMKKLDMKVRTCVQYNTVAAGPLVFKCD
jgi:hypothetical protein